MRQWPRPNGGYLLITSGLIIISLISFASIGLTRSLTDLQCANHVVAGIQAFHTAEAGVDGYLAFLRRSVAGEVNQLLSSLPQRDLPCDEVAGCTILEVRDDASDDAIDGDPSRDSNKLIVIKVQGLVRNVPQMIEATLYVDTSNPMAYPYSVAGKTINMDGKSMFGDPLEWDKTIIYAQGPPDAGGSFLTTNSNAVWAKRIAFYNPTSALLPALCQNCDDPTIFHSKPSEKTPPTFDLNAPKAPDLTVDLKPYYDKALMTGHVISATPAQAFKDTTLTGVYYVECGVSLTFSGTVTIHGTIIHEGCGGTIELLSQATLILNSTTGASPFAPGMAIIGAPMLLFKETATMNITGIVMTQGGDVTNLKASGKISGSLLAVEDGGATHADLVSGPGPGADSVITYPLAELRVENAQVTFSAVTGNDPSLMTSGVIAQLRAWRQEDAAQ